MNNLLRLIIKLDSGHMKVLFMLSLLSSPGCSYFAKHEDDENTCWSGRNGQTQCQENENIVNPPIQL